MVFFFILAQCLFKKSVKWMKWTQMNMDMQSFAQANKLTFIFAAVRIVNGSELPPWTVLNKEWKNKDTVFARSQKCLKLHNSFKKQKWFFITPESFQCQLCPHHLPSYSIYLFIYIQFNMAHIRADESKPGGLCFCIYNKMMEMYKTQWHSQSQQ